MGEHAHTVKRCARCALGRVAEANAVRLVKNTGSGDGSSTGVLTGPSVPVIQQ